MNCLHPLWLGACGQPQLNYFSDLNPIIFDMNVFRWDSHFSIVFSFLSLLFSYFRRRGYWFFFVYRHVVSAAISFYLFILSNNLCCGGLDSFHCSACLEFYSNCSRDSDSIISLSLCFSICLSIFDSRDCGSEVAL